jgi:ABC-type Fe3+-hydroxamate transport system substrate-binding protein
MISAVGFSQEEITITALAERMEASEATEEPEVVFAGSYEEPDYKTLIKNQISLAILPSDLLPREVEDEENSEEEVLTVEEQTERYNDITGYFATLSIPVVIDRSKDEETDLAKYEWIKVYGALFGCEEEANQLYNAAQENYNEENRNQ